MAWISCDNRLPKCLAPILFVADDQIQWGRRIPIEPMYETEYLNSTCTKFFSNVVTHWQYIPELPRKRQKKDKTMKELWKEFEADPVAYARYKELSSAR